MFRKMSLAIAVAAVLSWREACPSGAARLQNSVDCRGCPDFNSRRDGRDIRSKTLPPPHLMVVFTCNHCPTAQAYDDRIKRLYADYGQGWLWSRSHQTIRRPFGSTSWATPTSATPLKR